MKIHLAFAVLTIATTLGMAQDRIAESLRKGVVEEESKHNLNAAIQHYQTALAQFDEARQTAATALFRMAESYRKQGKDDQAIAAYKRVAREFADQGKLAEQSRSILAGTYHAATTEPLSNNELSTRNRINEYLKAQDQARQAYRNTLVEEVALIEKELQRVRKQVDLGAKGPEAINIVTIQLVQAQRQLYEFDAGIVKR